MKLLIKIFALLIISFLLSKNANAQQPICCPEFKLFQDFTPCEKQRPTDTLGTGGQPQERKCDLRACKHTTHTYHVMPATTGYTYNWQVTGGTPTTATGNNIPITWGLGTEGKIKIFINNNATGCKDTLTYNICLEDAPTAGFNISMTSPICLNQNVNFTNTSVGAINHYWDFGDGSTSSTINPSHAYTTPGTYTITLTVDNGFPYKPVIDPVGSTSPPRIPCGCKSTITKTIVVKNESPLTIEPGCKQMLCAGDTAYYCTPNNCTNYNWSVTGGHIIGGINGKCIAVAWDGTYPATVTLNSNCGGTCGNTATIQVPVLFATMPITGNNIACPASVTSYSLPSMPGTFYNWSLSGGGSITGPSKNTAAVNVTWGNTPGTYTLTCDYNNPHTKCSGKATITVKIVPPYKINGPTKSCVGNNFSYVANGPGTWSVAPTMGFTPASFATGNSISGTWNKPGTYTITATPSIPTNFCSSPATLVVIVKDTPKLNNIIGPIKICPSGTSMYQINSNMNEGTFYWSTVGGSILSYMGSHRDSVVVAWNPTGPYSISVSQVVDGCASSQKKLDVVPYSQPLITGTFTTCMDNILTYTATGDAPPGGYTWSLSNGLGTLQSAQGSNTMQVLWHGAAAGSNTCVLTVTTCAGASLQTITVIPMPVLKISKTGIICSSSGITLTASIAGATSYNWIRLPGTNAGTTQSINITQSGTYELTVVSGGCSSKATIVVLPENLNITANISTADKTYWKCTETISTTLQALPATGYCYKWFRTSAPGITGFPVGSTISAYTATSVGYYYCEISICGTSCVKNTNTIRIDKESCDTLPPCTPSKIDFSVSPCNPFTFTAIATPTAAMGTLHWYFGDGKEAWGTTVTHLYKAIGTYKVCVTNSGNTTYCRADTCKDVQVTLAANWKAIANCDKVNFTNLSQTLSGTMTFNWSFPGATVPTSTAANPVVTYTTGGLHTATLTVSNGTGCTSTYTDTIRTYNIDANMSIPSPICAKTEAPFTATSSSTGQTYHWDFGDGYISNLQTTNHAYAAAGTYLVQLTTTNPYCSRIDSQIVNVLAELTVNIGSDKFICPGGSTTLSAPTGFGSYQWYKDGVAIAGANAATFSTGILGEYWVKVSNGNGCVALSNKIKLLYASSPVALIKDYKDFHCSGDGSFVLSNSVNIIGDTYSWQGTGPSGFTFSSALQTPSVTAFAVGQYQFILTVTNAAGCSAIDTLCFYMGQTPTVTITSPTGTLCEGKAHTFTATASPSITPASYLYQWSNTIKGNTMTTGMPGVFSATAANMDGCFATAVTAPINPRPNVSLFPRGCDTLCLTDTIFFPLPTPMPYGYNITWYDDAGTLITPVGTGLNLPLAGLSPGIHHFFATVSFPGGCADTTGKYDLYVRDCTLEPPCDNCIDFFGSARIDAGDIETTGPYQTLNQNIVLTINKPAKEIRISLADLQYYWNDPACKNCKVTMLERGCLLPGLGGGSVGSLSLVTPASGCNGELVFKGTTLLPAGTYNIPVKISLPLEKNKQCQLIIKKLCYNITLIDSLCRQCIKPVCFSQNTQGVDNCKCNATNDWTNLNMIPTKPGMPKPRNQILCGNTLTDMQMGVPYLISGVYNCQGTSCASTVNEINVYNQVNQITYTKQTAVLFETISFDTPGYHTVQLIAHCGTKKCECSFRVLIKGKTDDGNPKDPTKPTNPIVKIPTKTQIDSVLKKILPKDFNGGVFIAKEDSTIYEEYKSYRDSVTEHTAFDLASITKTFTAMAILKMMEDNKLKLEDVVNKYLPLFPIKEVTIQMLLSHTSGMEDYLQFMDAAGWDKNKLMSNDDLLKYISANPTKVMIHAPGKMFDYSNTNFSLLSLIVEKISGLSYAAYMQRTFFDPLKMTDTYVLSADNAGKATKSYYKNGTVYSQRYLDLINGDKCIYSTVRDLQKWNKGLRTMFKKSTIDLAYTPMGNAPAMTSNYALGWKTIRTTTGLDVWYHTGWWAGSRSLFIRLPKGNIMIAVMSNNNHTTITEVKRLCDLFGDYNFSNTTVSNF